ncbi:MAG TPA: murein biosynthesis integral membrane protein MurJ, partial [Thermoanaerobaculia bacterium]
STKTSGSGGHAALVAAGIFLSRIAGLVRQGVLSYFLGTTGAMSAFTAAMRIPNFLQNLLGEGVLSASMIPVYARLLAEKDEETASKVAGTVASLLALTTAVVVVAGVLFAPALVGVLAPGFDPDMAGLTIAIVRILFPGVGLLVLSAWCLAVLTSHRLFFVPYVAPVLWNVAIIAALLLFGWGESAESVAIIAGWGVLAGSVLQLGIQLPFVRRVAPKLGWSLDPSLEPVRRVFRNFGPVVIGRGVVQVSAFVDAIFASYLTDVALGAIGYAYQLYLLPFSLFGMSVSAAELPAMSSAVGSTEEIHAMLRQRLRGGLRQIAFFVVPSVFAFFAIGDLLVAALYERGVFSRESSIYVWYILMGYAIGLLPGTLARLYSSGFYALRDTRTPLYYAVARVSLSAGLGWVLAFPLRPLVIRALQGVGLSMPRLGGVDVAIALGAVGLSAASGIVSWIEYALLRRKLQRRIGAIASNAPLMARLLGAAIAASAVALLLARLATPRLAPSLHAIPAALAAALAFGLVYLGLASALGVAEVRGITRRLRR